MRAKTALLTLALWVGCAWALAADRDVYAIKDARIVTVTGPTIEKGKVVIRDGLIVAVGSDAAVPPEARIIDGSGLTIYPGLIDAHTSLGLQQAQQRPQTQARSEQPPVAPQTIRQVVAEPSGLKPEAMAADLVRIEGAAIEAARNAGITTALTVSSEGIFQGQSALINLAGTTQEAIVKSPVALHIGFTPFRNAYPNSLMGVFALLRQSFLDAEHYQRCWQIYERQKRGVPRPEHNKSLEALASVLSGKLPVVFSAHTANEIRRAIRLAEEFKLRYILSGASEGWKVAEELRAKKVQLLVSLNFQPPRRPSAFQLSGPEPEDAEARREERYQNAAALYRAGVKFALHSGGLQRPQDFFANIAKAIEKGLPREEALRALTINAAEILGVSEQLGSIEAGKIANLVVTSGDIFDKNAKVRLVFIDGKKVFVDKQN